MIARVYSATVYGLEGVPIEVEVRVRDGAKHRFTIIGLGDSAVREATDRVISALRSAGLECPDEILVNLAPAEVKKEGSGFDLPIAIGILVASEQLSGELLPKTSFHGELSLDGKVKSIRGAIALAVQGRQSKMSRMVVPQSNVREASLVEGIEVIGVDHLSDILRWFKTGEKPLNRIEPVATSNKRILSLDEVWGQERAKRALEIAAAGSHNLLMIGPPGCGKSMLAERLPSILPPLDDSEKLEVLRIHSVAGLGVEGVLRGERPFRAPHHLISDAGLTGGGSTVRPGEISLSHRGVLFLDELPEFRRSALESLRAPLETGKILVSRARGSWNFPARFQLIAAMNPCPCGRLGVKELQCLCSRGNIFAYLRKLSQPLLDRIDLHVDLHAVALRTLVEGGGAKGSSYASADTMKKRIQSARDRQFTRYASPNNEVSGELLRERGAITPEALSLIERGAQKLGLSGRGFLRILRVARTIADLEGEEKVLTSHAGEAVMYRSLERIQQYCEAA